MTTTMPVQSATSKLSLFSKPPTSSITDSNTLSVFWSKKRWKDLAIKNGYTNPVGAGTLPGCDFVNKLSLLLNDYLDTCSSVLDTNTGDAAIKKLSAVTEEYLNIGDAFTQSSIELVTDTHQLVHIQELSYNFLRTILVIFDRLLGSPDQLSSTTRPKNEVYQLHPDLCGLVECGHILETTSTHQGPRIPYAPHRTGREITYEEIANLFRTSRVNIRRLEVEKCRPKLRSKLKDFNPN